MKYDKTLLNPYIQGKDIDRNNFSDVIIAPNHMFSICQRFMGAGMSQNFGAIMILEHYNSIHDFQYVIEIGSEKGCLSTYLANLAGMTERFFFETYEISKQSHWYNREIEGAGHWFEKLEKISPFISSHEADIFSDDVLSHVEENMHDNNLKTLIFCDGGNKIKELEVYAPLLKPEDRIMVHDWNIEISEASINHIIKDNNLVYDEPMCHSCGNLGTTMMVFRKS